MPFTVYSPIRRIHHFMDKHLELTKQLVKLKKADILMVILFFSNKLNEMLTLTGDYCHAHLIRYAVNDQKGLQLSIYFDPILSLVLFY